MKAYVKRQKNDASDAKAICEAASRPMMRFVAVKVEEQQAFGMLFRTRDLLVPQRTQAVNALRGHLAEFGVIAPKGPAHVARLASAVGAQDSGLPETVRELGGLLLGQIPGLNRKVGELESRIRCSAYEDEEARRLMSIPGIGSICTSAMLALAQPTQIQYAVHAEQYVIFGNQPIKRTGDEQVHLGAVFASQHLECFPSRASGYTSIRSQYQDFFNSPYIRRFEYM